MKHLYTFCLVLSLACGSIDAFEHFIGHQVIRATARSSSDLEVFRHLSNHANNYDFWLEPLTVLPTFADIRVTPENQNYVTALFQQAGIEYDTFIPDLEKLVVEERNRIALQQNGSMTWTEYHPTQTIYSWLDSLQANFPGFVSQETYGQSFERRDLRVLKVGIPGSIKPKIWIDSAIHAREWVAPAVSTYMINQLVTNVNHLDLLSALDFYFVPLINPDGYEFTHTNNRMWRKTRSPSPGGCFGVDGNRNFGYMWGVDDDGSSPNPCSDTYRGEFAYSEPEAQAVRDYIERVNNSTSSMEVFITLHSYGQLWMSPYDYSAVDLPEDFTELKDMSDLCVAALRAVHGTQYTTGSSGQILYKANGCFRDWAKVEQDIKWAYTVELRSVGASPGFLLPPQQIIPTAEETWEGIQVLLRHVMANRQH